MVDWSATYESEGDATEAMEGFVADTFSETLMQALNSDPAFVAANITVACRWHSTPLTCARGVGVCSTECRSATCA